MPSTERLYMFGQKKSDPRPDYEYFTIYDSKSESYREPMLAINEHDMVRQISNLFADPAQAQNQLLLNAEDFSLFSVGFFSKKTGSIESHAPRHIANLHEIRTASKLN